MNTFGKWTNTEGNFSEGEVEQSITARFEQQVAKYAGRVALKTKDQIFSYAELNKAANRVAHAILAARGEGVEPIALLVEQGATAVVTLLGILKAGKFYVPLDPSHPRARLIDVVRDVEPGLILTNSANLPLALEIAQGMHLVVNSSEIDSELLDSDPKLIIRPDALGYLFYTSGSTGRPKGVTQSQRNILHQIMTYSNALHISADDHITLLHSHSFSASRLDLFGALLNGAALFPFSVAEVGITGLIQGLKGEAITLSHWVPTLFRHFANTLASDDQFAMMRAVVLGSESVLAQDIALYKSHFPSHCVFVNRFGTTETGNVCLNFLNHQSEVSSGVVPVGFPVPGAHVFLVDGDGNQVASGGLGEICVQSRYLSQGYWKQPELTRARFRPDPSRGESRIYLTGDLGRIHPDGCLEHLGRKDSQVKLRGFRIEKQEIEALLNEHPSIREAVVEVEKDANEEGRLVGYLVLHEGQTVRLGDLRNYLKDRLPQYMVPSSIVFLKALPQTANGKIDREALAAIKPDVKVSEHGISKARNATEKRLIKIWETVLGIRPIGVRDNFFDLGGQSLLAIQLTGKIKKVFGRQWSPAILYQAPTIEQLAELLRQDAAQPGILNLLRSFFG